MRKPIIAISMGDPGGIGPEVIAKSLQGFSFSKDYLYLIYGVPQAFEFLKEHLSLDLHLQHLPMFDFSQLRHDAINFVDVTEDATRIFKKAHKKNPSVHGSRRRPFAKEF